MKFMFKDMKLLASGTKKQDLVKKKHQNRI